MAKIAEKVLVISHKGTPVARYNSVEDVAREYHCSKNCVRNYIESGKLWKAKKVFLDLAL